MPPEQDQETNQRSPEFISASQLLKRIQICKRTLQSWVKSGQIPAVRLRGARRVLYHWPSVESALLRNTI